MTEYPAQAVQMRLSWGTGLLLIKQPKRHSPKSRRRSREWLGLRKDIHIFRNEVLVEKNDVEK